MAAFAPLNQIVWRDYGGLERNVSENKLATSPKKQTETRGGQQHAVGSGYGKHR